MCWFLGLGLSLAIPTSQKPFLFTIYGTHLLGTPGWVVAPPFWELGPLQGVLGRATRSPQSLPRANRLAKRPHTRHARAPTSPRSIGFCAIWDCISSSSSSNPTPIGPAPRPLVALPPTAARRRRRRRPSNKSHIAASCPNRASRTLGRASSSQKWLPRARRLAKPDADWPG